jgi:hypothetical protein
VSDLHDLLLSLLLNFNDGLLPFVLNFGNPPLTFQGDGVDLLQPFLAILLMIKSFLVVFFLPLADILLQVDLKQRLLSGLILRDLSQFEVEVRLHDTYLLLELGAVGAGHLRL